MPLNRGMHSQCCFRVRHGFVHTFVICSSTFYIVLYFVSVVFVCICFCKFQIKNCSVFFKFIRAVAAAAIWEGILCNISADVLFHTACSPLIQGLWTTGALIIKTNPHETHRSGSPSPVVSKGGWEGRRSLSRWRSNAWQGRGSGRTSRPGAPPTVSPGAPKIGLGCKTWAPEMALGKTRTMEHHQSSWAPGCDWLGGRWAHMDLVWASAGGWSGFRSKRLETLLLS